MIAHRQPEQLNFALTNQSEIAAMTGVFGAQVTGSRVGTKYRKALYVEYTDATFTTKKPQPAWQGSLGPTLRAEVI
jgi:hypothetical protein